MERPDIEKRRDVEDRAIELGAQRHDLQRQLRENTQAITDLVRQAMGAGIGIAPLARLLEVSRQTLYHWHEVAKETGE